MRLRLTTDGLTGNLQLDYKVVPSFVFFLYTPTDPYRTASIPQDFVSLMDDTILRQTCRHFILIDSKGLLSKRRRDNELDSKVLSQILFHDYLIIIDSSQHNARCTVITIIRQITVYRSILFTV